MIILQLDIFGNHERIRIYGKQAKARRRRREERSTRAHKQASRGAFADRGCNARSPTTTRQNDPIHRSNLHAE